jgi:hypothetical protein
MSLPRRPVTPVRFARIDRLSIRTSAPLSEDEARRFAGLVAHALSVRTHRDLPALTVPRISVAVGAQEGRSLKFAAAAVADTVAAQITTTLGRGAR